MPGNGRPLAGAVSLDFQALRGTIERREVDLLLGFYSEEAELRGLNAEAPVSPAFELRGRTEV